MKEKNYVYIQSSTSIMVTAGLQNENVTNPDAHIPDRLKVNPLWPKLRIMIKQGRHIYPKLITEWPAVKALVKDSILTIGEDVEDPNDSLIEEKRNDLKETIKEYSKIKDINLESLAE